MNRNLPEFNLAIIGGCMSHQHDVPFNGLYQRRLAAMLKADPGVVLRPYIVRDFEMDLRTRLDRIPADQPIDGVLAHIRAANMVVPAHIFRRLDRDGHSRLVVNPALFRRRHADTVVLTLRSNQIRGRDKPRGPDAYGDSPNRQDRPPEGLRIAGFRARNLNIAVGSLVGLDNWAIAEELRRYDEFEQACRERGLPLFVLGPASVEYSYWTGRIVRKANARILRRLAGGDVPFALIEQACDAAGRPLTRVDGIHLTVDGQRFVARLLYEHGMREWVSRSLGRQTAQPTCVPICATAWAPLKAAPLSGDHA
jgi:hypothetical protein